MHRLSLFRFLEGTRELNYYFFVFIFLFLHNFERNNLQPREKASRKDKQYRNCLFYLQFLCKKLSKIYMTSTNKQ